MTVFFRGRITPDYIPLVRDFFVVDAAGDIPIEAILDTGFSGQVTLRVPRSVRPLGQFELIGVTNYELASGEVIRVELFKAAIRLGRRRLSVDASFTDSNVGMIGLQLIDGKRAIFDLKRYAFRVLD